MKYPVWERRLRKFLFSLSPVGEFALVAAIAFGPWIVQSLVVAGHLLFIPHYQFHYSAFDLELVIAGELVSVAILLPLLKLRSWSIDRIGLTTRAPDIGWAVLLFLGIQLAWIAIWQFAILVAPHAVDAMIHTSAVVFAHDVPLWLIIAASLLNPLFEETFEIGYVMTALDYRRNPWLAINVSVAIRLALHLYQGGFGVLMIIPFGLIFSLWFARTGRLWPLILAHGAQDFLALHDVTSR